jgi:hypothetical protein
MPLDWHYNVGMRRWETRANGWRLVVARWAGGAEWIAVIESLEIPHARHAAEHVFRWVSDAQAWCEAEVARRGNI